MNIFVNLILISWTTAFKQTLSLHFSLQLKFTVSICFGCLACRQSSEWHESSAGVHGGWFEEASESDQRAASGEEICQGWEERNARVLQAIAQIFKVQPKIDFTLLLLRYEDTHHQNCHWDQDPASAWMKPQKRNRTSNRAESLRWCLRSMHVLWWCLRLIVLWWCLRLIALWSVLGWCTSNFPIVLWRCVE